MKGDGGPVFVTSGFLVCGPDTVLAWRRTIIVPANGMMIRKCHYFGGGGIPVRFAPGSTAVVFGGGSGIGTAIVHRLHADGVHVIVCDLDEAAAQSVAEAVGGVARQVDVTSPDSVGELFAELDSPPRLLIHSAGGAARKPAIEITEDDWLASLQLNAGGFFRTAQHAAAALIAAGETGSFVQVASALHRGAAPGLAHFSAAKAASVQLVRCFAHEWAAHGIRVNAVVPGPVDTPMTQRAWSTLAPKARRAIDDRIPLGRVGTADEVAAAAAFLLSDDSAWTTGSVLDVDGGLGVGPTAIHG
jgi:NAD(P)-dependent dehydrogenase (short-subunit alcohol dehydrogenase family)